MKRTLLLFFIIMLLFISGCISSDTVHNSDSTSTIPDTTPPPTTLPATSQAPDTTPPPTTLPATSQPPETGTPKTTTPPTSSSPIVPPSHNSNSNFPPDIVTTEPPPQLYEHNWTEIGHDSNNSCYTEDSFGTPNETWAWRVNVGEHGECRAIIYEGKVFVTCRYLFFCLDLETGKKLWDRSVSLEHQDARRTECTPVAHDGKVYITVREDPIYGEYYNKLHCYDCETGTLLWASELLEFPNGSPTYYEGCIYVPEQKRLPADSKEDMYSSIEVFDARTGRRVNNIETWWRCGPDCWMVCDNAVSILIHDDIIYTTHCDNLLAFDIEGDFLWEINAYYGSNPDGILKSRHGVSYYKDNIYVTFDGGEDFREDGLFACFSLEDKTVLWRYEDDEAVFCSTSAVYDDKVYFVKSIDKDSYVCCVDAFTGEEIWVGSIFDSFKFDYAFSANGWMAPIIAGDRLYVGNTSDEIFCFDADSGELLWEKTFLGEGTYCPLLLTAN